MHGSGSPAIGGRCLAAIVTAPGMTSRCCAERLHISAMAVRQHLYALQAEHLVTYEEDRRAMGRPVKLWQLTPAADRFFPEGYAELTLSLLQSVTEAFGTNGLEHLLSIRTQQQIAAYRQYMAGYDALPQRLAALAAIRTEEGYMARVQPQVDGSFLLLENHCPISAAAVSCTQLCRRELDVFQAVLGTNVLIERTEHIVAGARRCAYRVASAAQQHNDHATGSNHPSYRAPTTSRTCRSTRA